MKAIKSALKHYQKWYSARSLWVRILFKIFLIFLIVVIVTVEVAWYYRFTQRNKPIEYGVSFSVKYAQELGVDWRANYSALLDDLGFKELRLMSYWDLHEPEDNAYNFEDLDWQMNEAAQHGAKVMLSVGLRQPRWPECHTPAWAASLEKPERHEELYEYIATVVQRYSSHPALESYQLENEYYNRSFGDCDDYSRERLAKELDIVKNIDPVHPVVISFADQLGMPLRGPHPDIYGTSLYRGNFVRSIGYFSYPISSHFYGAKAQLVRWLHGRDVFIHELQTEPWGPKRTKDLSREVQDEYMPLDRIEGNILFARRTGMKKIYLWGGEWWYWRKTEFNDPHIWEGIRHSITETGPVSPIVN